MEVNKENVSMIIGDNSYHCPIGITMDLISGKWKTTILWYLRGNCLRFGELRKLIPPITERVLSLTLQQLEDDGLISKTVFNSKAPFRVEYALTDLGNSLLPVLESISKWGFAFGRENGHAI